MNLFEEASASSQITLRSSDPSEHINIANREKGILEWRFIVKLRACFC